MGNSVSHSHTVTLAGVGVDVPVDGEGLKAVRDGTGRKASVSIDLSSHPVDANGAHGYAAYRLTMTKGGAFSLWDFCTKEPKPLRGDDAARASEVFNSLGIKP